MVPRANINLGNRIDAVRDVLHIQHLLTVSVQKYVHAPMAIVVLLKEPAVNRIEVRRYLNELLDLQLETVTVTGIVRRSVALIETSLGMRHDDRSIEAFLAFGNRDAWGAYVARLRAEVSVEIEIPTSPAAKPAVACKES